jgi:hypothetical protein
LRLWGADVGNDFLEATTKEKVYKVGGPDSGLLEGNSLVIDLSEWVKVIWFVLSPKVLWCIKINGHYTKLYILMQENGGFVWLHCCLLDALLIAARDLKSIVQTLQERHKFNLKEVGSLTYYLRCDYFHDMVETFCYRPRKYIDKIMGQYENIFGCKPPENISPLKGNHPDVYCSDDLDRKGIKRYQTMIGCLQWAVSLRSFDMQTATMTKFALSLCTTARLLWLFEAYIWIS